jgi:hypothetical protein
MPTLLLLDKHRRAAESLAVVQGRAISRRQLAALVPRWFVRNELRQRRWQSVGKQVVVTHNGPLGAETSRWAALLETGSMAVLDGVTALQAAGLTGLSDTVIDIAVPRGSTPRRVSGARIHETRRFRAEDVIRDGMPRMAPATAAVHAGLWARTDREARLFVVMAVQQRLATPAQIAEVVDRIRRHPRRRLLRQLVVDVAGGVESLNELDVAGALRRRGLPEPRRQSIKVRPGGVRYLDNEFPEYALNVEVDGMGHDAPESRLSDLIRDVDELAAGSSTVRIPMVAWRLDEESVLDALERLFRSRGWRRTAA